jgi:hypothetical protein
MHDAAIVSELQGLTDRRNDGQGLFRSQAAGFHRLPQVDSVNKFHQQEIEIAGPTEIVDGDNVRMIHFGEDLPFTREPIREVRVVSVLRSENLQRDQPP